jgi:hypothetical protein
MNSPSDFYAQPGEPIRPKLKALAHFVVSRSRLQTSAGIRKHEGLTGTSVVADLRSPGFGGFFGVVKKDVKSVTVRQGFVNGSIVPTINGVPCDGIVDGKQDEIPVHELESGPNADKRSWVCIRAVPAEVEGEDFTFEIADTNDGSLLTGKDDELKRGLYPIAMIIWADENEIRTIQRVSYFNLQHRYDEKSKRHTFR